MDLSVGCTIVLDIVNALNMSSAMNMHIVVDVVAEKLILRCRDIGQATLSWDATTPHMRYLVEHQLVPSPPSVESRKGMYRGWYRLSRRDNTEHSDDDPSMRLSDTLSRARRLATNLVFGIPVRTMRLSRVLGYVEVC